MDQYPLIDDRTGFRISSRDAIEDWGGVITHRDRAKGMPQTLIVPELPEDDGVQEGPVRADKFRWSSRELYDFEEDVVFNDIAYKTTAGLNSAALNPEITLLQSQNPTYWDTVNGTWDGTLMQFVNRTYNQGMDFGMTTIEATWGEDIEPTFIQFQPE